MATSCSHSVEVQLLGHQDKSKGRIAAKSSGMRRVLSWATVLTAEFVVRTAGDDSVDDDLAKFGPPGKSD